jgi:hypothetical protein
MGRTAVTKGYGIVTLVGERVWPPYWHACNERQQAILRQASEVIRDLALALDWVDSEGTHVCNHDLQFPPGTIIRNREASIARAALDKANAALKEDSHE